MTRSTTSTITPEFGYFPDRETGIVEKRRRPGQAGLWSEIERLGAKRYIVRSQVGTQHPDEFQSISKALAAAKDLSWCPECVEAIQNAEQETVSVAS